jgi:hypothetical protein
MRPILAMRVMQSKLGQMGSFGAAALVLGGLAWSSRSQAQASVATAAAAMVPDVAVNAPGAQAASSSDAASAAPAATWSFLYARYLAAGTVGDCGSCHAEAATPKKAYAWLAAQQYMAGSGPYLIDPRASCLSWLGGDMPPDGPTKYARATRDFASWASAGMPAD